MNTIDDGEKDAILLSLAITALLRPGWNHYLSGIAEKFGPLSTFEGFKQSNADQYQNLKELKAVAEATKKLMQRLHTLDWAALDGGSDAPKCISRNNFKDLLYNYQQPVDEALAALKDEP